MNRYGRALTKSAISLIASVQLALVAPFGTAVSQAADNSLAVPGTTNSMPDQTFSNRQVMNFVTPTNPSCVVQPNLSPCTPQPVDYPAALFPLTGLNSDTYDESVNIGLINLFTALNSAYDVDPTGNFYVTGYSQGATVGSYFKNNNYTAGGGGTTPLLPDPNQVIFVFAANPNRPNGGIAMRPGIIGPLTIPILGITVGVPASTDRNIRTSDIVIQYDGISDLPQYPLNLLSLTNALVGVLFIHPSYVYPNTKNPDGHPYGYSVTDFQSTIAAAQAAADMGQCSEAVHCQQFGDTTYITLPTTDLPILAPLRFLGERFGIAFLTRPLADLIQPVLRVLIETGYDRTSYGTPTPFQFLPPLNPTKVITLVPDLVVASIQGINDALGDINGTRPAPPPTQDPFATALDLFSDQSTPSAPLGPLAPLALALPALPALAPPAPPALAPPALAPPAPPASATVTTTTLSASAPSDTETSGASASSDTETSGASAPSDTDTSISDAKTGALFTPGTSTTNGSTIDMKTGAMFTPGGTSTTNGTTSAQDPISSVGLTGGAAPAPSEPSGPSTTTESSPGAKGSGGAA